VFQAKRSASTAIPDDDEAAAERAAYVTALEEGVGDARAPGNPRAEQVRAELTRVRNRHLSAA
jgi:hypothetical protein